MYFQGSQFFLFRVDPFSENRQTYFDRVAFPENLLIALKCLFFFFLYDAALARAHVPV